MAKYSLDFTGPYMNAAGMLGFTPDKQADLPAGRFGAFVTNPVSLRPRKPANGERIVRFSEGVLLHTGHPNPGLSAVIRQYARRWARLELPVIVHLIGSDPNEISSMVERLEDLENVAAVELGLPAEIEPEEAAILCRAAAGELPCIVRVPPGNALLIGEAARQAGADAISIGPARLTLEMEQGESIAGRVYGPAQFPASLQAVKELAAAGVPVIGAGGIYHPAQAVEMLDAGAAAVQLDTVLWRGGFEAEIRE